MNLQRLKQKALEKSEVKAGYRKLAKEFALVDQLLLGVEAR